MKQQLISPLDLRIFQATPGICVLLRPEGGKYTVVAVSDDFLASSSLKGGDTVGKNYFDLAIKYLENPEFTKQLKTSFESVIANRRPHEILRDELVTNNNGSGPVRWHVKNVPLCNEFDNVEYIIHSNTRLTVALDAEGAAASVPGIEKAYRFFMQAPVIVGYVRGNDYTIDLANDGLLKVWKKTKNVIGRGLFDEFPELEQQGIRKILDEVRNTGKPFFAYEFPITFDINGKETTSYFDFIYHPYYENDGDKIAAGIVSVGHDVTEKVLAKQKFRNVIEQTTNPILILVGEDLIMEAANKALLKIWNVDESAIGKRVVDVRPLIKEQGFLQLLQNVYRTGVPFRGFGAPVKVQENDGSMKTIYFNYSYQPYREANGEIVGVIVMASDATEQVVAEKGLKESQRKWRELADTMPTIVWTGAPDGKAIFFNQRWYEFSGLTEQESLGSGWMSVLHPDDVERCFAIWQDALREERFYQVEARYRNREGAYRWIIARGVPIKEEGKVVGWYGTSTDIHEQKQLELGLEDMVRERTAELATKNLLLDNILKNSSNGISVSEIIFDNEGNVIDALTVMANEAAVNFSGIPREIYLSRRATELDPDLIKSPYGQACIKTLRTGEPTIMQYYLEFTGRWLELTVSKLDESHLIHIFTDVTPIKKAQIELEKSLDDLKFANANLEEFAYAASHDLKEPVRKIRYFAERLKVGREDHMQEKEKGLFERLEKSAARMEKLIDDLLEYSQTARGTSLVDSIDLSQTVDAVLEDLELEIQKKHAEIFRESLPTVHGNTRQIQQLFQNLISNALKYSKPGVTPQIRISCRTTKGKETALELKGERAEQLFYLIEVSDNGIGFDQSDAERMFALFTRLHSDVEYRGSGVGLSIAKKVAENHNGFIWAKSERGNGSTFSILLPAENS